MKALWALLLFLPSTVFADSMPLPIDAHTLYEYLTTHHITTKRALLASLPDQLNRRVVLMSHSKSRHRGTPQRPRVIHWSPGARFIMAHSGHADDPQADDIEIIQVNDATHRWEFFTIRLTATGFAAPVDVTTSCAACHGTTPRPIWGPYPDWPDAYQGGLGHQGVDRMAADESQDFSAFIRDTQDHEAYSHLDVAMTGQGYRLRTRYGLPNTHFGARLGTRHAAVVFSRLKQSPHYARHAYQLVRLSRNSRCAGDPRVDAAVREAYARELAQSAVFRGQWADRPTLDARTQLYRLLGVDPGELRLDRSPVTPGAGGDLEWNMGSDGLGVLLEFQAFYDLLRTDASLQDWFKTRRSLIDGTHWAAFEATAAEIVAMAERHTDVDDRIKRLDRQRDGLVSQGAGPAELAQVDAALAAAWRDKHDRQDYFSNGLFPFLHFNIFRPVLEREYTIYVPMTGDGHKAAVCAHLTRKALES